MTGLEPRTAELLAEHERTIHVRTDRLFARLLPFQWLVGVVAAVWLTPLTWAGRDSALHVHLAAAVLLGGAITLVPAALAVRRPGTVLARHAVALGQGLFSALLIHLSGGRIETHFLIFGSLAFIAFYRDWRVLMTMSTVVALDHLMRGLFWPQSVFGVLTAAPWRWLEHTAWVAFENLFLVRSCLRGREEMRTIAERTARLEALHAEVEEKVQQRTAQLREAHAEVVRQMEERTTAQSERDEMQERLARASKLEAVGRLAAGVAHEINTPTQFVTDNTRFLGDAFGDLLRVLEARRAAFEAPRDPDDEVETRVSLAELERETDLAFLEEEVPRALAQSAEGLERIASIVRAMKSFAHPGDRERSSFDLNESVRTTVVVARNEWKYVADVELDLDPALPLAFGHAAEINQVVLNLLVNAAQALASASREEKGRIRIVTRAAGTWAELRVEDDGPGVPEELRERVFEPFFTTKEVGQGTGQGLALAHSTVTRDHGGSLACEPTPGGGATFVLTLPLAGAQAEPADDACAA